MRFRANKFDISLNRYNYNGILLFAFSFFILSNTLRAQSKLIVESQTIKWGQTEFKIDSVTGLEKPIFNFSNAEFDRENDFFPFISLNKSSDIALNYVPEIEVLAVSKVTDQEKKAIKSCWKSVSTAFEISSSSGIGRGVRYTTAKLNVLRSDENGTYEKLVSYKVNWKLHKSNKLNPINQVTYVSNSVLASGDWYKIGITKNGVYKIDKTFLQTLGLDINSIDPRQIKIFGNGGRILSEKNSDPKPDDLNEIAIMVSGESDGIFDAGDYILFYGKGPNQWEYKPNHNNDLKFEYIKNYYSDTAYYFITTGNTNGKRITSQASLNGTENYTTSTFDDFGFHEFDHVNLIKSGRELFGESFDIINDYTFGFNFPNMVSGDTVYAKASVAGRNAYVNTIFNLSLTDNQAMTFTCSAVGTNYTNPIADEDIQFKKFVSTSTGVINATITKQTSSSTGWFNYLRLNARRSLIYSGSQLSFRDTRTWGNGIISKFILSSFVPLTIWDITDHSNVKTQSNIVNGNQFEFSVPTDTLKEFIAFGESDYFAPTKFGKIANQNLHALTGDYDYIIITHPDYKAQALELAELHQQYDTLDYVIATPQEIYNEFSSGSQDITALREFVRMLYTRATVKPRYLLLFGDGSYLYKNAASSNTNFIPTYQTYNSLAYSISKTSDDFYGLMDSNEGDQTGSDIIDLGIGRLPVKTVAEANAMVEKVKHYYLESGSIDQTITACDNNTYNTFGDWRNWITFLADDAEAGAGSAWELVFVSGHSEQFANQVKNNDPTFNIDKIYLDAYQEFATSGGQKYPDAEAALNRRVQKGSLILNYSGHGGELQLTSEGVVDVNIVNSWKNLNNMPMFVTATCEFSRFDDPSRTSCGEFVLLNNQGGGICLFTTTRLAYSSDANSLCPVFFNSALQPINGNYPRTGDIIRLTKSGSNKSYIHFTLLGDPAVRLAYPKEKVFTTEINSKPVTSGNLDTLKALTKITVKGFVGTKDSIKLTNFNGIIFPTVFDKPSSLATLGNDQGPSGVINFNLQKNVLYKGKASVTNGEFEFTFIVPKDINYQYGNGKISYYAHNGTTDAAGYFNNIVVGGSNPNAPIDQSGPEVNLYMNDANFVYGGTTNENPKIYMTITDSSGINTVGNGIGHDITAILDNNVTNPIVLNDFYESNTNSYQSGKLFYPLTDLAEGNHTLTTKVWDIQNNSTTSTTEFVVAASAEIALRQVLNYPNPFTTKTQFYVEHNQCCMKMDMQIQIFTVSGKLIKTISQEVSNTGFRIDGVNWDGKDEFGDKIGAGVYIYKIRVRGEDGKSAEKIEKLVILN